MNCSFLAELLYLLAKKLPRKQYAIKNDCTLACSKIYLISKRTPPQLDDNDGDDLEVPYVEEEAVKDLDYQDLQMDATKSAVDFISLPDELLDLIISIFLQVNECSTNLGLKVYELSAYIVILLMETRQLGQAQNLRYFADFSDLDIASNIIAKLSYFVEKHYLMYPKAMIYTLGAAYAIECADDIYFGYRTMNCLITKLFSHLFYTGENGIYFVTDVHVTSFFRRTFINIYSQLLSNCYYYFESPIVQSRNKIIAKLCMDYEMEYIIFIVFYTICYYHFDFLYRTGRETNIESSFVEVTTSLFASFKDKPAYGERLVKLLQKYFEAINRVESVNLHSVQYYTYILVMIGKIMQYSMEINSIDLYRIGISLIKQVHYYIIQYNQLRSQFFILYDTFVLYVVKSSGKMQFRIDALMSIVTMFLVGNQSQILDLYFTLYDLNGLPLITNILKMLISMVNDQSHKIQQPINNFKRYKVQQLVEFYIQKKKIVQSGWIKEDIYLQNLQELVLIVFMKFFRCYQTADAAALRYPVVYEYFERQACIAFFNKSENPGKALNVFIKHGYCTADRLSIVHFLIENNNALDKAQIGQLLGGNKPLNSSLLETYTEYLFANVIVHAEDDAVYFITALRTFLTYFKSPGESYQIDRILQSFSRGFAANSPDSALPQTSAYILSYATMMLNTDMHNYSVKEKMTRDGFVSNTMRADSHFSQEFLFSLYDEIGANPLTLEEVELARSEAIYGELGYYCYYLDKIQNILRRQLFIDEKISVINIEENSTSYEDIVTDDGMLACKTIYLNLPKTPRADTSSGFVYRLTKQYDVKPVTIALLEFYSNEIFAEFMAYMDYNQVYRRFRFSNEIMFHLYRLARISPDCQRYRSAIITRLLESFFCYARQTYPLAELAYQLNAFQQYSKQYTTIEDRNETTNKIARNISEELTMAVLLLTIVDNNVTQSAFDLAMLAYFISMQNFNLVCTLLGRASGNIYLFADQINASNLYAMFDNDQIMLKYANEFQKFFVTFPLFYPSLMAKNGYFLYLLDFDKCFSSLVLIGELMMLDWDLLCTVTDRYFKSHLQQTYLFDFLAEFYVNYFVKFKQVFDPKTQVSADFLELRQQFIARCEARNMSSGDISLYYFYKLLQHLGSVETMLRRYNKEIRFYVNLCRSIQSIILNFFSQQTPIAGDAVVDAVIYFLCHLQRGTLVPQASLLNIDTVTQIIPLIAMDYPNLDNFILFCHASLHRIVTYNVKSDEYLSCAQCHHAQCWFVPVAAVLEDSKYATVYCKSELAWQECYQQIVILINTMGNKIYHLKARTMQFVRNEIALLKQFYESKIAQIVAMSLNFALEYMCYQCQPEYTVALNLLSEEIVMPNLVQAGQAADSDAYNTLTQHFFKVLHASDAYWSAIDVKTAFVESVFGRSIYPIILQHKQAKQYTLFYYLTAELLVVFSSQDAQKIEATKPLLHSAFDTFVLLFSQKFPSKTNFYKLLEVDFYNLLQCQMQFQQEYETDVVRYVYTVFRLLLTQHDLINDQSDVFYPLYSENAINLRYIYLLQAYESFASTLNKFPQLSDHVKSAFYHTVHDTTAVIVQLATETTLYSVNITILVDFFNLVLSLINQNAIQQTAFNKDIGFQLTMQIMKFCFIFANQQTSNQFLTMVQFTLQVIKRLLAEFSKDVQKCDLIHAFLIKSIRFNDSQVRENIIDCFDEYHSAVVEYRAERLALQASDLRSVEVDNE